MPHTPFMTDERAELEAALRQAGLRVTAPRLAVLRAIRVNPHATVEQLLAAAREQLGAVSTQAVYDIVSAFERAGLVRRIQPAGHASHYEGRVGDNHHHVVCRRCGAVADVDCAVGAMPCLQPSSTSGFTIEEAEINFWGLCPACAEGAAAGAAPDPTQETTT
jgi:Fur family ferric uptake transcriptional regulator